MDRAQDLFPKNIHTRVRNQVDSVAMARWLCPTAPGTSLLKPSISLLHQKIPKTQLFNFTVLKNRVLKNPFSFRCSSSTTPSLSGSESDYETEEECVSEYYDEEVEGSSGMVGNGKSQPPVRRRRRRYRKQYPGEMKGITEEMRFVAMKLRNNGKKKGKENSSVDDKELEKNGEKEENFSLDKENYDNNQNGETWQPSMEGFLKYLVDSKLVFSTVERIVDQSSDVSCKLLPLWFCVSVCVLVFFFFFCGIMLLYLE